MLKFYTHRVATPLLVTLLLMIQGPATHAGSATTTVTSTTVNSASGDEELAARINREIGHLFKENEPGATIIVTRNGLTVFRQAYGMADLAKGRPMTPDTLMRIASITKQFTATGILMLADEDKLALGDDISKFLPDYPSGGGRITIENLLTHTSGIASYTSKPTFEAEMNKDLTVSQMVESFKNDALQFEPGTRYSYSNSGYFLLGAIIEKVSGLSYAKFVEQRIFVPLGMSNTAYEGHERGIAIRAQGYTRRKGDAGFEPGKPVSMTLPYAAGALVSTVDDLARWDAAVSAGKLLKPSSQQKAFTAYVLADGKSVPYGYGWSLRKMRGTPMQSHGGGIPGFSTYALRLPEKQLYVAVLTNADSGLPGAEMIALRAATIAVGEILPD